MNELNALIIEYEEKFGEVIPLAIVRMSEEKLRRTLRECIQAGKPYELGEEIQQLLSEPDIQF